MRNIFLEKSYTKCGGETIPRPFPKISKLMHNGSVANRCRQAKKNIIFNIIYYIAL